jgi:hypothetical protein
MPANDPLLTIAQLAAREGIKEKALRDLKRGHADFPAINVGTGKRGSYKIRLSEWIAWLARRRSV